ncbi:MAG: hypothetical protein H6828_00975 [Planctomycetes bacterium]|nr:hypothetical protein [Planctomycetota bacterium]
MHYALLAELCGADVLVLGPDVASPTTGHGLPAEIAEYRAQALRATAARARACFSGALAYCASWPAEVLEFGAWDAFDLVGVAWFPAAPKGAEDALVQFWRAELGRVEAAVARAGKPWMLLETGVRSTSGASLDARFGRGPADGAAQARALRALARVLTELGNEGRAPDGLFWWHWDAAADAPGAGPRGYSPQGKPGLGLFEGLGAGR